MVSTVYRAGPVAVTVLSKLLRAVNSITNGVASLNVVT